MLSNNHEFYVEQDKGIPPEDAFVVYEQLPDDFVHSAASCLAFARTRPNLLGLLSRRDIEAIVSNGTPFLFKSALDTARRMREFLASAGSSVSEVDQANTVDLMKYILSYASNPTVSSERNGLYSRELVDSSVRNLLHELSTVSIGAPAGYVPASQHHWVPGGQGVASPVGQNIVMKRGDWICPKCEFMNFARNMKCLECEGPRPKKQLTGGEWECPECYYFNYGRNSACLRCDCSKPGLPLFNTSSNRSGPDNGGEFSYRTTIGSPSVENKEKVNHRRNQNPEMDYVNNAQLGVHDTGSESKDQNHQSQGLGENFQFGRNSVSEKEQGEKPEPQRWFKRMMELHDSKDMPSERSDDDFSAMPMRKGENRFVVSKNKDLSQPSPQYKRQVAMDQASNANFVPFVPFPPGYFARKDTGAPSGPDSPVTSAGNPSSGETIAAADGYHNSNNQITDSTTLQSKDNQKMGLSSPQVSGGITAPPRGSPDCFSVTSRTIDNDARTVILENPNQAATGGVSSQQPNAQSVRSGWSGTSLEGSAVTEPDPLDMSEEAKAERWFKRVAQIKDISELSQIPDEDFPSIMPMRKGVNRFVVSKRKKPLERRLTSQQYRRNLPIVTTDPPVKREGDNS